MKMKDLKLTEANRDINENQVKRLEDEIRKHGYIEALPILVDQDGFIVDGQHRYIACRNLNIEPTITVVKNMDLAPVLNATQLSWSLKDYVKFYAEKGIEDYIIIQNICKAKNITPNVALSIIFGRSTWRPGIKRLTNGNLKANPVKTGVLKLPSTQPKDLAKLDRKIDLILGLVVELGLPRTERLIVAIAQIAKDPNFVFKTMKAKIEYQRARIYRCTTIAEYTQMLANIYNNKNPKKIVV